MIEQLIRNWFTIWENGEFENLQLTQTFTHTSPYGVIEGKEAYLNMVRANKEAFLGNTFVIIDQVIDKDKACVRYSLNNADFSMDVAEWFYIKDNLIDAIVSYYNVGKVDYNTSMNSPDEEE